MPRAKRIPFSWTCSHCHRTHDWRWNELDLCPSSKPADMRCPKCRKTTPTFFRIAEGQVYTTHTPQDNP